MRGSLFPLFLIGAVVVVVACGLGWQRRAAEVMRAEVERLRGEREAWTHVQAENRRLAEVQVSETELKALRGDHAAVERLRGEIEGLRKRAEESARAVAKSAAPRERVITEVPLAAGAWKNSGNATPVAAFETVLWAAAGGDVDKLASLLRFDEGVRSQAEALFSGLSAATRAEYGTAERLIAALTARDVPLGTAKLFDTKADYGGDRRMAAQLKDPEGKSRVALFSLRPEGGTWGLVVPASAVEKYTAMLKGAGPEAGK